ncbi:MAG: haloacid dehalogenase-like hydrolase [Holophagales bacterium]|nr:haloacid dehalogenase-like hydrolase [Holophagales bacterium]
MRIRRRLARRTSFVGHLQSPPEAFLKPTPLLVALLLAHAPALAGPRLETRLVASPHLEDPVRIVVQLPPSFGEGNARRYPVLYFLHDGFGSEETLAKRGIASRLDAEMAAGRLPEMLVVSPRGVGTWFTDSHDGKVPYGAFLSSTLVPYVDGAFPTLPRRSARAAAGISMGGYGAVRWGLGSPELFTVTAGLSAAVQQLSRRSARAPPVPHPPRLPARLRRQHRRRPLEEKRPRLDPPRRARARRPRARAPAPLRDRRQVPPLGRRVLLPEARHGSRGPLRVRPRAGRTRLDLLAFRLRPVRRGRRPPPRPGRGGRMSRAKTRLVLFDIDGTLLSSGRKGLDSFSTALRRTFGTEGDLASYRFEGKLDPVIVFELMRGAGIPDEVILERRPAALSLYLDLLEEALSAEPPALKPGVADLVARVTAAPTVVSALLTGNVQRGARIKLTAAGLWDRFLFGVFGDEAPRRVELGPIALARALERTGRPFSPSETVVVGDARADVECGRAIGARVVAVATGRTSVEELHAAGADTVLSSFADVESACEAILA